MSIQEVLEVVIRDLVFLIISISTMSDEAPDSGTGLSRDDGSVLAEV